MKVGFYTLGCKVNQYETQAMEQSVVKRGHEVGEFGGDCDIYVVNTCTVTAVADQKNRSVIRRCKRNHPEAVLGVCGCYGQMEPEVLRELGADVISGSGDREAFLDNLFKTAQDRQHRECIDQALRRRTFEILPAGGLEGRTRAMLKVQDGCNNFCTYCIIPYARGPVRSAQIETVLEQARLLEAAGYQELVITGIEIASWGWDLPEKPHLSQLLTALCENFPKLRLRLGSLEPRIVDEEFVKLSRFPNLCPQFHLSMQSGSDGVLKRMRRKYDTARFLQSVQMLNEHFPHCAVTTDLIVGFPGETEAEFQETLAFLETCGFAAVHVFPYSRRPGTPAAKMDGQLTKAEKEERSVRANQVAKALEQKYLAHLEGEIFPVLFEEDDKEGHAVGHTPNYAKVYAPGHDLHNIQKQVKIGKPYLDGVLGEIVE